MQKCDVGCYYHDDNDDDAVDDGVCVMMADTVFSCGHILKLFIHLPCNFRMLLLLRFVRWERWTPQKLLMLLIQGASLSLSLYMFFYILFSALLLNLLPCCIKSQVGVEHFRVSVSCLI